MTPRPEAISVIVPLYDEVDNVAPLLRAVHDALADIDRPWELICVDDGSADGTSARLEAEAPTFGGHVRVITLARNYGQTAAMQAGIDAARGSYVVTMDGDLQNDPRDIPRLIAELEARDLDLLVGWRKARKDGFWLRRLPSRLANRLIGAVTGVRLHDYGCSLKVMRSRVVKRIRLYGEMHRFIPVWMATETAPGRIGESVVRHHARRLGQSKYGLSRTFRVLLDLLTAVFFLKFHARPGHFFGALGLTLGLLGSLVMAHLAVVKFGLGEDIGGRPLFFIGILLLVAAVQLLTTGVLAELLSRTFFESSRRPPYALRDERAEDAGAAWREPGEDDATDPSRATGARDDRVHECS